MRATESPQFRSILGIEFFVGNAAQAVQRMNHGGLLVVPAAPALKNLPHDAAYREALLAADLVITDSAFMVLSGTTCRTIRSAGFRAGISLCPAERARL